MTGRKQSSQGQNRTCEGRTLSLKYFGNWWYFIFVPLVFLLLFLQVATAQLGMIVEKHNTIPAAMQAKLCN